MAIELNNDALDHAEKLLAAGKVVRDERDDWSEHAPSTDDENRYIDREGWEAYSQWHLGVDPDESDETKGRFSFPFGDFTKLHRCAVISLESRAGQYDHDDIERAAKQLLEKIDAGDD
jgi:hypothetical protein